MSEGRWIPYNMILAPDQPGHSGWNDVIEARRRLAGEAGQDAYGGEYIYRCLRCKYQPPKAAWGEWFTYDGTGNMHPVCPECHNDPLVALAVAHNSVGQKSDG